MRSLLKKLKWGLCTRDTLSSGVPGLLIPTLLCHPDWGSYAPNSLSELSTQQVANTEEMYVQIELICDRRGNGGLVLTRLKGMS